MPRSDRLFDLLQLLQDGALLRAEDLAARMGVSTRTIYRDMDRLTAAGVPVKGSRGAGYTMEDALTLPPLTLTAKELEALNLGLAIVAQAADAELQVAADALANKVDAVLTAQGMAAAEAWKAALNPFADPTRNLTHLSLLRPAIRARQKVALTYTAEDGTVSRRTVRPLHLEYRGRVWALTSWCEGRERFELFRLDLIETAEALPELFVDEPGKRLKDYAP
ncbi:bifunctional biotin--[acetyl-CoA-carboxylase] synthetase/biotin operon repressor [Sulfitobacter sp. THAF37]|uniref:helix-turn-helix transcriptional regulator n=1 Tax=Sulfitobacter sp. THAF37 TaxID=2587855 RepID=UPI001268CEB0|nr:WYL domain-containing protein [Sulfitobacter sp. THAF37]QFT59553.1 bifunctional biotin--[acetyl-CoA-carboxylase] synthetase/biotin operon repressor [Sulfitobacter sp. THAF37]